MQVMDRNLLILLLFSLFFLPQLHQSQAQWKPQDIYRINCGASSSSTDSNGLDWQPDTPKLITGGTPSNASTSTIAAPYNTARIFTVTSSYSFTVTPGRHWIRLHFSTFFDQAAARFSVSVGSRLLLHNTSVIEQISAANSSTLIMEFSIHASSTALAITFIPLQQPNASYAFISGIELISMAHDSISPAVIEIEQNNQNENRQLEIPALLTRTLYRLNVGGGFISPANDSSSQGRSWLPDDQFLQGAARGAPVPPAVSDIEYPSTVPEYIAPRSVYGTARSLGSANTVSNAFNISWVFALNAEYTHYVRLHFAEIVYSSALQRIFSVYINNKTAIRALDLIQQTGAGNIPYFKDFLVLPIAGLSNLRLQIGPLTGSGSQFPDAILNGLEIFRLNDSSGNVDGLADLQTDSGFSKSSSSKTGIIVGAVAGGVFAAAAIALGIGFCCFCSGRIKGKNKTTTPSSWHPLSNVPGNSHSILSSTLGGSPRSVAGSYYNTASASAGRYFSFQEIVEATNGFDEARLLGVGGFGRVYKGEIDNGTIEIAVKRGNPRSDQGIEEFQAEIGLLSKLRHRHLVSLIGYCDEQSEMILVYEFMARGPLRGHLYGGTNESLSWRQRLEIMVGAARGLHYLHTGADHTRAIIHRDVKTTNILLDEQLVAKVSDFGLSKTGPMLDQTHVSTAVKGSFGYLDPEYFRRQQLTDKSDVYSFGVVIVEVLCARPAIDPQLPRDQVNIAEWAMQAQRSGRLEEILDRSLFRPGSSEDAEMSSVRKVGEIAEKCLQEQGVNRPSMGDVLWNLESALHIQEAAARRHGSNGGAVEMVTTTTNAAATAAQQGSRQTGAVPVGRSSVDREADDDYYDGYSEDTSASAVFSQLVNPQGR